MNPEYKKLLETSKELCLHIGTGYEPHGQSMSATMAMQAIRNFRQAVVAASKQVDGQPMSRPDIYHIVDNGVNNGRTHTLCGIEMNWTDPRPLDFDTWCPRCMELDG